MAPLHALTASACPVIVKPLSCRVMCPLPNAIHGAPVTVQVTSPTRRLSSLIVRVDEMSPLTSSAEAAPIEDMITAPTRHVRTTDLRTYMTAPLSQKNSCNKK